MKVRLQTLLTALVAVLTTSPAWADGVEVTDKLVNPDFYEGLKGWTTEFTTPDMEHGNYIYYTTVDNENNDGKEGYWFFDGSSVLFHAEDDYIGLPGACYQTIEGLPNGAYVFSGVSGMVRYGANIEDPNDLLNCQGSYFFANGDSTLIQGFSASKFSTEHPWCHTVRFNVATTVTDGKLTVGQCFVEGNNAWYCSFDQARLYYFGDVDKETAMLQMRHINVDFDLSVCDTMKVKPMSTERYEHLCAMQQLAREAQTYDELSASLDSMRLSLGYARQSNHEFETLLKLVDTAKDVVEQEWSDAVIEQIRQLGIAIDNAEKDIAAHAISDAGFDQYVADFQNTIDMVRIDNLWDKFDELNDFLLGEPSFGIEEHPGFGTEDGQYPLEQEEALSELYDEVNKVLADIENGDMTATSGFAYIAVIESAIKECLTLANGNTVTLPYDYILDPDPDDPSKPFACKKSGTLNQAAIQANHYQTSYLGAAANCYRLETPFIKTSQAYSTLTITVLHTHQNKTFASGGPAFSFCEFYLIDADGNRVELDVDNFSSNAKERLEGSYYALYDNDIVSYFHSSWSGTTNVGNHNLIVTLPKPMDTFKMVFESQWAEGRVSNTPTEILISGQTAMEGELTIALNEANKYSYTWGQDPFFYATDLSAFNAAKAKVSDYLDGASGTDSEMQEAADALYEEIAQLADVQPNEVTEGAEYFITSRQAFVDNQAIQKNLSVYQDSILIWETADATNPNQKFIFTKTENEGATDGLQYYTIKNVGTGKYVGPFISGEAWEPTGEEIYWGNPIYLKLGDEPGLFAFKTLQNSQVAIVSYSVNIAGYFYMACHNSNSGKYSDVIGSSGASAITPAWNIQGVNGPIVHYNANGSNTTSAFSVVPAMQNLPATISAADATDKKLHHFTSGGKLFLFVADKPCAFTNFKVLDKEYNEVAVTTKNKGSQLVVTFPKNIADFYFTFDNNEGVQNITVNIVEGGKTKLDLLQEAYDKYNFQYTVGTEVGCVKDVTDYNAALAAAEELLVNGGDDETLVAATEALQAAANSIEAIQPEAGKRYLFTAADRSILDYLGCEVAIYVNPAVNVLGWYILDAEDEHFQWEFEKGETDDTWYIRNVATGTYINYADATGVSFSTYDMPTPYEVIPKDTATAALHCTEEEPGSYNWLICMKNVSRSNTTDDPIHFGPIQFNVDEMGNRLYIREVKEEDVRVDELEAGQTAPAVEGIYDLTGRRVAHPAAGIYIVNGKKILVK